MTTYRSDVKYLQLMNADRIEANAKEFRRVGNLLEHVDPDIQEAKDPEMWGSESRGKYDARLADVGKLAFHLSDGLKQANTALVVYADDVRAAQTHLKEAESAESKLREVIDRVVSRIPTLLVPGQAEPLRQWDAITSDQVFKTKFYTDEEIAGLRDDGFRVYGQASDSFARAKSYEESGRDFCVAKLKKAYDALPDYRGDFTKAKYAAGPISDKLANLRKSIPTNRGNYPTGRKGDELWLADNAEYVKSVAAAAGLPPEFVAANLLKEGYPWDLIDPKGATDDAARLWKHLTGQDPDRTSFGSMQMQVRRAADVLGYDPENLTAEQRSEIVAALKDRAQSVAIGAEFLERLKAQAGFADIPADQLTPDQLRELAARYNGGPRFGSEGSQAAADETMGYVDDARRALSGQSRLLPW